MYSKWTDHLPEEDKERFRTYVLSSKDVLGRATDILKQSFDATEKVELGTKWFDTPNWSHKQAFINGYKAGLTAAMELLDLDKQEQHNERFVSTGGSSGKGLPQRLGR